ncbi:hypothetical protein Y032_0053g2279 [Ancylostoma ceylanicum]|uniref:EndoU domain-containing protein n=1 Tax=Ancylostoma ceylanicum TaxID=53326 RepID=A0A016U7C4_9BILA|nr:hypothetical protein Y032_0053g2279 [Ancylostoma ceylanicum]
MADSHKIHLLIFPFILIPPKSRGMSGYFPRKVLHTFHQRRDQRCDERALASKSGRKPGNGSSGHPFAQSPYIFRTWIEHLWFKHYSRSKGWADDSSAFEHVFMGEEKKREVSGFHNWVRFYLLERNPAEELNYMGFIEERGNVIVSLRFKWQRLLKRVGSFMIGTSPEFEMALYTLCFLARRGREKCTVEIDGCLVIITSYDMVQDGEIYIGTAYPKAGKITNTCGDFYKRGF